MLKKLIFVSFLFANSLSVFAQSDKFITRFESSKGKESATYFQTIAFYKRLAASFPTIKMEEAGETDTDYPLHVIYFSKDGKFDINSWKEQGKVVILINNGIHPGEPDGIDASMMLLRDASTGKISVPDNVVLALVPIFNIGGALERHAHTRVNQNGPAEYGFRGNAQNLDLNRDFIKLDAKETRSLVQLFHRLDPDIFVDNHVSDGADYQHIMTLLSTQHNKLGGEVGYYMHHTMEPLLYADMKKQGYDMVPYVNDFDKTPDMGWREFYDAPRFSSGFATLFQTFAFVPETHMLKPFAQRVAATYALMQSFIAVASQHAHDIHAARAYDRKALQRKSVLPLDWKVDTTRHSMFTFKGYEAGYKPSEVSGKPRLYYDRSKPYTKQVPIYDHFIPAIKATVPEAYVIQQGWGDVIQRLNWNGVKMTKLQHDTTMRLTAYKIDKYDSPPRPYEKHFLHHNVQVTTKSERIHLHKGDYIIYTAQPTIRYIVETLEPTAPDAYFAWGFFDAILQQKEYFSDYVFEDQAAALLRKDKHLQELLIARRKTDTAFANSGAAQLDFVYRHSPYYEPVHVRYPVFRLE
ncbi:MAG: M14 family metallopeptidase [Bacteroidota bacterium]